MADYSGQYLHNGKANYVRLICTSDSVEIRRKQRKTSIDDAFQLTHKVDSEGRIKFIWAMDSVKSTLQPFQDFILLRVPIGEEYAKGQEDILWTAKTTLKPLPEKITAIVSKDGDGTNDVYQRIVGFAYSTARHLIEVIKTDSFVSGGNSLAQLKPNSSAYNILEKMTRLEPRLNVEAGRLDYLPFRQS